MNTKPHIIKKFNSAAGFLDWAANAPCQWEGALSSRREGDAEWAGTDTFEEAYNLALYGWEEGLEQLTAEVNTTKEIISPYMATKDSYDVAGYRPHPARASSGDPLNMIKPRGNDLKPKPIINIRVDFGCAAIVDTKKIIKWGAAICSYVDAIEQKGYSVQLDAFLKSRPSTHRYEYADDAPDVSIFFPLKKAGDPLSLSNVIFWWAHPAAQRRIGFSACERLDIQKWYGEGYGKQLNAMPPKDGNLYLSINDAGDDTKSNLEIICKKHQKVLDANNPLRKNMPKFN